MRYKKTTIKRNIIILKSPIRGFTLIEVSIVAILMLVVFAAVYGLQYALSRNQLVVWKNYINLNDTNSALQIMMRELRAAQVSATGAYPLEKLEDNEVVFYSDFDYDAVVEKIRYSKINNNLLKGVTEPSGQPPVYLNENENVKTISEFVRNTDLPLFYYYNGNWPFDTVYNPLPQNLRLAGTRGFACYLRINDFENDANHDTVLQSFTQIRILKDNL